MLKDFSVFCYLLLHQIIIHVLHCNFYSSLLFTHHILFLFSILLLFNLFLIILKGHFIVSFFALCLDDFDVVCKAL